MAATAAAVTIDVSIFELRKEMPPTGANYRVNYYITTIDNTIGAIRFISWPPLLLPFIADSSCKQFLYAITGALTTKRTNRIVPIRRCLLHLIASEDRERVLDRKCSGSPTFGG